MAKKGEASFGLLIQMCETVGHEKGIAELEKIVCQNENWQAHFFADPATYKQAQKLGRTIIAQNISIARLKEHFKVNQNISSNG